ncbi:DUF554 domain-containing protein [Proteinivorax hydrogeniformans]|uniref:DUF554 domain-containing protein n=1 Tax=Proteinivorax hydrogeniformans TaxID=1826727 RepID=A0AAU8HTC3_9FIRM
MGNLVNAITILVGGTIGVVFKSLLPERMQKTLLSGLGILVALLGVGMFLESDVDFIVLISALVVGIISGEWIDIDRYINKLGDYVEKKMHRRAKGNVAQGFVFASLTYCVGPLAVIGAINEALGFSETLYIKAAIDGVTSVAFASAMGVGVIFSAGLVFIYQGAIFLMATALGDFFNESMQMFINGAGGILIVGIGINILGIKKIKVANMLPVLLFGMIYFYIIGG